MSPPRTGHGTPSVHVTATVPEEPPVSPTKSVSTVKKEKLVLDTEPKAPSDDLGDKQTLAPPNLRKMPSTVSLSATRPASPSAVTPTTPSLSLGAGVTTDDEETDFQSAYSASPRGSYGSFENFSVGTYPASDSEQGTPTRDNKARLDDFEPLSVKGRERVSSTSTATDSKVRKSGRTSEETVITRPMVIRD